MDYTLFEEYITLQQLLKNLGIIHSGGAAKSFLNEHTVFLNGEEEARRGRKIRTGDLIIIKDLNIKIKVLEPSSEQIEHYQEEQKEKVHVAKLVKEMNQKNKINRKGSKIKKETRANHPRFPGR